MNLSTASVHTEHTGVLAQQEQLLAREHRAESARSRKKQAAAEAAAGKTAVTGGLPDYCCHWTLSSQQIMLQPLVVMTTHV